MRTDVTSVATSSWCVPSGAGRVRAADGRTSTVITGRASPHGVATCTDAGVMKCCRRSGRGDAGVRGWRRAMAAPHT